MFFRRMAMCFFRRKRDGDVTMFFRRLAMCFRRMAMLFRRTAMFGSYSMFAFISFLHVLDVWNTKRVMLEACDVIKNFYNASRFSDDDEEAVEAISVDSAESEDDVDHYFGIPRQPPTLANALWAQLCRQFNAPQLHAIAAASTSLSAWTISSSWYIFSRNVQWK